jgi:hypothetical protein
MDFLQTMVGYEKYCRFPAVFCRESAGNAIAAAGVTYNI